MKDSKLGLKPDLVKTVKLKGKAKPLEICIFNSATNIFND
jgi:hypothetical protein